MSTRPAWIFSRTSAGHVSNCACWALIREKFRYIFFGSFPYEQHWRPLFAVIAMLVAGWVSKPASAEMQDFIDSIRIPAGSVRNAEAAH